MSDAELDPYLVEAYQVAVRNLATQLEKLRSRAIAIVAMGGAVGSLVGRDTQGSWVTVALILFGLAVASVIGVLWPVEMIPGLDPTKMVATVDAGHGGAEAIRSAALHADQTYRDQKPKVRIRIFGLVGAVVFVGLELVAFFVAR